MLRGPNNSGGTVMSEIERVIEKENKKREKVISGDPLLEYFDKAKDVLDINYQLQKEQDDRDLEEF